MMKMKSEVSLIGIPVTPYDVRRFAKELSPDAALAAAIAWAALREVQVAMGPGHSALDLVASNLPTAYRLNWAKKLLEESENEMEAKKRLKAA